MGLDGLVVAGRAISATHEAAGSVRGQGVCMATGHAAGTIAAMSAAAGAAARRLTAAAVQKTLRVTTRVRRRLGWYPRFQ